jgi:hypothetical protein
MHAQTAPLAIDPAALTIAGHLADRLGLTVSRTARHFAPLVLTGSDDFTVNAKTERGSSGRRFVLSEARPPVPPHPDGSPRHGRVYWPEPLGTFSEAGVSLLRDPQRAAADLARRLSDWPQRYAQRAEHVTSSAAEQDREHRETLAAIDRLGMCPPYSFNRRPNEVPETARLGSYAGHSDLYAEARFYHCGGLTLRLSLERLTVEEARAALDAVQQMRA